MEAPTPQQIDIDTWFRKVFFEEYKVAPDSHKSKIEKKGRLYLQRYHTKHIAPLKKELLSTEIKSLNVEKLEKWDKSWNQNIIDKLKLERDYLNSNVSPKRENEMVQFYKFAQAKIKISGNNNLVFDEVIDLIESEYQILKGIFLSAYKNPDLRKNSFFYRMDFERWHKALIVGGVIYFYTCTEQTNLFFTKPIRLKPELLRLLATAHYYGMNSNQAFNYVRYVYTNNIKKNEILLSYKKIATYKKW